MKITIVGAGNMGLCLLGYLVSQGHEVILYTSSTKLNDKTLVLKNTQDNDENVISGFEITSSISVAFKECDIVFCTYPAFLRKDFINKVSDFINPSSILCFIPGYGGAEYYCDKLLSRGVKICGFQRVPYVARYDIDKNCVFAKILSIKTRLFVAAIPREYSPEISVLIESLLHIPTIPLKEYLAVTMSPSNPLLHISGIYTFFKRANRDMEYASELNFYEEWDDSTSQFLFEYDKELHKICDSMGSLFCLDEIIPLSIYYESPTPCDMTDKLKKIEAFKVVKMPLKKVKEGIYVVDLESRMFTEDFPYGVCMFKALAQLSGIDTPIIDRLLLFYEGLSGKRYYKRDGSFDIDIIETGIPQLCGIKSLNELSDFYSRDDSKRKCD